MTQIHARPRFLNSRQSQKTCHPAGRLSAGGICFCCGQVLTRSKSWSYRAVEDAGIDAALEGTALAATEGLTADTAVPIVGWMKFGYDVVSFGTSMVLCW
jgi:hypothetical protein